jgi:hypothetical protein
MRLITLSRGPRWDYTKPNTPGRAHHSAPAAGDPSRRWRRSHLNGSTGTTPAGSCAASADVLQQRPRPRKKADRLPVRVTEHNAIMPSGDGTEEVSETCTVITHPPRSSCRARGRCLRDVPDPVMRASATGALGSKHAAARRPAHPQHPGACVHITGKQTFVHARNTITSTPQEV